MVQPVTPAQQILEAAARHQAARDAAAAVSAEIAAQRTKDAAAISSRDKIAGAAS